MEDPKVSNSIAVLTLFVALKLRSNIFVSKYTTLKKTRKLEEKLSSTHHNENWKPYLFFL